MPIIQGVDFRTKTFVAVLLPHPTVDGGYLPLSRRIRYSVVKEVFYMKKKGYSKTLRRITLTAVFTALAVVIKCFTKVALTIPGLGIQISFGGIFTFFPAILFGPLYGGAASALCDFLGAMIAPTGAYIPWLTLSAFVGGFVKGFIWKLIKKADVKRIMAVILATVTVIGAIGVAFTVSLCSDGVMNGMFASQSELPTKDEIAEMTENGELSLLSRAAVSLAKYNKNTDKNPDGYRKNLASYLNLLTAGLEIFAIVSYVFCGIIFLLGKVLDKNVGECAKIFVSIIVPGLIVTTLNTYILSIFVTAYAGRSLVILWVPRAAEELVVCAVQTVMIALLYGILMRSPIKKQIEEL